MQIEIRKFFLLGLLISGILIACQSFQTELDAQDVSAIDALYMQFHNALSNRQYETAYSYMSPEYRQTRTLREFVNEDFLSHGEDWLVLHSNRSLKFRGNKATLYPLDKSVLPWSGPEYTLIKVNRQWYLTGEYFWHLD